MAFAGVAAEVAAMAAALAAAMTAAMTATVAAAISALGIGGADRESSPGSRVLPANSRPRAATANRVCFFI